MRGREGERKEKGRMRKKRSEGRERREGRKNLTLTLTASPKVVVLLIPSAVRETRSVTPGSREGRGEEVE